MSRSRKTIAAWVRRSLAAAVAAVPLWLCIPAVHAATITVNTREVAGTSRAKPQLVHTLRLTGMIETGDANKLREILTRLPVSGAAPPDTPSAFIELSSLGGDLVEGLQIGELFRKFRVSAVVRRRDLCLSSCALALLGGNVHRIPSTYPTDCNVEIGGKVGFHNFSLNRAGLREVTSNDPLASRLQGFADARGGAALLVRYAAQMGLPPNFVASMIGRPVEDYQYIETVEQFLSLRVCPIGLGRPSIALEAQAANVCRNSAGVLDPSPPMQATPIEAAHAKRYLLERVQANMQSSRAKGRLAAQLADGSVMRVREEINRLYDDLRAAGLALPDIVGPTFEVGRTRSGTYETMCYVSLSPDDPDNFDVVLQGSKGLAEPPHLPPTNARRLFRFNRDDVINPRP